jgi:predicted kinase
MNLILLVGLPTSGKSSFVRNLMQHEEWKNSTILSTDNYIETVAQAEGSTHDEVFSKEIKNATSQLNNDLRDAIEAQKNIIWDQTNLTTKTRKSKLGRIPSSYKKVIVYFEILFDDALLRNQNRPGKIIPIGGLRHMYEIFEIPTILECATVLDGNDPGTLSKLTTYLPYLEEA